MLVGRDASASPMLVASVCDNLLPNGWDAPCGDVSLVVDPVEMLLEYVGGSLDSTVEIWGFRGGRAHQYVEQLLTRRTPPLVNDAEHLCRKHRIGWNVRSAFHGAPASVSGLGPN